MKKSNSKTAQKRGSGDEREDQRDDEQPTTSRGDCIPIQISHNMNDLQPLDFNSADEVRQAMKAILAGKMPPQTFTEEANHFPISIVQNNVEPIKMNELAQNQPLLAQEVRKAVKNEARQNLAHPVKNSIQPWSCKQKNIEPAKRKRRGRPPKAGPSKSTKKPRISSMYLGKLSNVVPFKRRRLASDSESDIESVVIFY